MNETKKSFSTATGNQQSAGLTVLRPRALARLDGLEAWRPLRVARRLIEIEIAIRCGAWVGCFGGLWWRRRLRLSLVRILLEGLPVVVEAGVALMVAEARRRLLRVTALAIRSRSLCLRVSVAILVLLMLLLLLLLLLGRKIVSAVLRLLWLLLVSIRPVFIVVIVMQHILLMVSSGLV
jgi:hypothetical protein